MTQTTNRLTTIDDLYNAIGPIGENRTQFRLVNQILRYTAHRPKTVAGQRYTTAAAVERAAKADAKVYAAIIAFMTAVRKAKTDTRVEAAITTLRNRANLMNCDTTPAELAAAIRNA